MSNIVKQTLENKLTQMKTSREGISRGVKSTEDDLAEQRLRLASMEQQIIEFEAFLNNSKFEES